MTADYPPDQVPATPEYVLALLQMWHRLGLLDDEPTFASPVSDLAADLDDTILFWWTLARRLNEVLELNIPIADWKPALSPMRVRTVRDVCVFVAARMCTRPIFRPWRHIAGDCLPAGAFLTMRALLAREGVDPDEIVPSTPLGPYLLRFFGSHRLWALFRAAPDRLPQVVVDGPPLSLGAWGLGAAVALMLSGFLLSWIGAPGVGLIVIGVACLLLLVFLPMMMLANPRPPRRVELDGLHTFRDLAYALAGQPPRRVQPTL